MKKTHFYSLSAAALASALLAGSAASAQAAQTTQPAGMVNPPLTVSSNGNVSVDPEFNQIDDKTGTSDGIFDSCHDTNCPCGSRDVDVDQFDDKTGPSDGIFDKCDNTNCPCPFEENVSVDPGFNQYDVETDDGIFDNCTNHDCPCI